MELWCSHRVERLKQLSPTKLICEENPWSINTSRLTPPIKPAWREKIASWEGKRDISLPRIGMRPTVVRTFLRKYWGHQPKHQAASLAQNRHREPRSRGMDQEWGRHCLLYFMSPAQSTVYTSLINYLFSWSSSSSWSREVTANADLTGWFWGGHAMSIWGHLMNSENPST